MILVDTSVWIDHLRRDDPMLATLLERGDVLVHSWVVGELALGNLRNRDEILQLLGAMPQAPVIDHDEVLALIADEKLYGLGRADGCAPAGVGPRHAGDAALDPRSPAGSGGGSARAAFRRRARRSSAGNVNGDP